MQNENYKFVLTTKSIVYHFGSRSKHGHFPTKELKRSSTQINYEQINLQKFIKKWGQPPQYDEYGFVKPIIK